MCNTELKDKMEKRKTDQDEVFEKLPVPNALRVMVVPAVISQLIVLFPDCLDRTEKRRQ